MDNPRRFGFVAIVGRPNVGKSTLLNRILGEKISIVTPKPQTTRHRVVGVKTHGNTQLAFVDTPGLHDRNARAMEQAMNRSALRSMHDADVILAVFEARVLRPQDQRVIEALKRSGQSVVAVVNKVDRVKQKEQLLPFIEKLAGLSDFDEVFPLSARSGDNIEVLLDYLAHRMPESEWLYPDGQITDRGEEFFVAEIIREKLMLSLGQELPYGLSIEIEKLATTPGGVEVAAIVWVERESQKPIVIGKGGENLKAIGRSARLDLKKRFARPVHVTLWVKVKKNWADNVRALKSLGYDIS